jgi:hypothetical protein
MFLNTAVFLCNVCDMSTKSSLSSRMKFGTDREMLGFAFRLVSILF